MIFIIINFISDCSTVNKSVNNANLHLVNDLFTQEVFGQDNAKDLYLLLLLQH